MPAPSPTTKPSRCASNGRLARAGSSLRVESAFIEANPPMPMAVLAFNDVESADPGGNVNADLVQIRLFRLPIRHPNGEVGASQGQLNEPAHFFELFFLQPIQRIETLDLAGDAAVEARRIKQGNSGDSALPGEEVLPGFLRADTQRANHPDARNDNAAGQRGDAHAM